MATATAERPKQTKKKPATVAQLHARAKATRTRAKKAKEAGNTKLARFLGSVAHDQEVQAKRLGPAHKPRAARGPSTRGPGKTVHQQPSGVRALLPAHVGSHHARSAPAPKLRAAAKPKPKTHSQSHRPPSGAGRFDVMHTPSTVTLHYNPKTGAYEQRARPKRKPKPKQQAAAHHKGTPKKPAAKKHTTAMARVPASATARTSAKPRKKPGSRGPYPKSATHYRPRFQKLQFTRDTRFLDLKSGKQVSIREIRKYNRNPVSSWGELFLTGGGMVVGAMVNELADRYVATRTPANGKHAWYGKDSAQRILTRPDGMRLMVGFGQAALWFILAVASGKRMPKTGNVFAGMAFGAATNTGLKVMLYWVLPMIMKVTKGDEMNMGNRLLSWEQDQQQKALEASNKQQDDNAATDPGQADTLPASYLYNTGTGSQSSTSVPAGLYMAGLAGLGRTETRRGGPAGRPNIIEARQQPAPNQALTKHLSEPVARDAAAAGHQHVGCNGGCGGKCGGADCAGNRMDAYGPSRNGWRWCGCDQCRNAAQNGLAIPHKPIAVDANGNATMTPAIPRRMPAAAAGLGDQPAPALPPAQKAWRNPEADWNTAQQPAMA